MDGDEGTGREGGARVYLKRDGRTRPQETPQRADPEWGHLYLGERAGSAFRADCGARAGGCAVSVDRGQLLRGSVGVDTQWPTGTRAPQEVDSGREQHA